jgi:membrane protein required for colicin V production
MSNFPTALDFGLLAIMLVSGLLAMVRGFMREILSIAAWGAAALVTLYGYPRLLQPAQDWLKGNDIVAKAGVIGGLFLGTLIVVSIITVRISNMILDSRIGALDRTLGFIFGLGRGLLIVVAAFWFFTMLVPDRQRPDWLTQAKSRLVLQGTADGLVAVLPEDLAITISKKFEKKTPADDEQVAEPAAPASEGYSKNSRDGLKKQIEKSVGR